MKPCALIAVGLLLVAGPIGCASHKAAPKEPNRPLNGPNLDAREEAVAVAPQAAIQNQPAGAIVNKQPGKGEKPVPEAERKIKYTADLRVICEEFTKAETGLKAAIKAHQALVAHSEIMGSPGATRSGQWRVRVPVAQFDDFREAVVALGEVEKNTSDSEDVTDVYYDLEAHIKNKLAEEESLRKLLEKMGGEKLESLLILRDKLAAVRDYINREQGKLRLLANLTDLTTVTVNLREKQKFIADKPPDVAETPTFAMRVNRTFTNSWEALVSVAEFVALVAVAVAPWLILVALVGVPVGMVARRWKRSVPVIGTLVPPPAPPSA